MCPSFVATKVPKRVRTTRDVERNWSWSQTESSNSLSRMFCTKAGTTGKNGNSGLYSTLSELEQIKYMMSTIANSGFSRCLKCARG